jgi:tetratricopeptide (TPR) repeat protein
MPRMLASACALLLLCCPLPSPAQDLPRIAEFYFDEDVSVTRPIIAIEGDDEATIAQLVKQMERGGRNADRAIAQLAHIAMATGRVDTGRALYARAAEAAPNSAVRHSIAWNHGWDLYHAGDIEGAIAQWVLAFGNRGTVRPAWVPPTLALALWKLGRNEEAVNWYAAAVRTYPDRWSDPSALPALLPDWTDDDRTVLAEVLEAWRDAPPSWP